MIKKGIFQWNEHYPSKADFENDIRRNELYVWASVEEIIGVIAVTTVMDEAYIPVEWLNPDARAIYIHRLAVHPRHQGKGYAQKLMDYAEDFARKNGFESIRLDTFSQNKRNQLFYEKRGYRRLGDVFFPNQSAHPFHCYESVL